MAVASTLTACVCLFCLIYLKLIHARPFIVPADLKIYFQHFRNKTNNSLCNQQPNQQPPEIGNTNVRSIHWGVLWSTKTALNWRLGNIFCVHRTKPDQACAVCVRNELEKKQTAHFHLRRSPNMPKYYETQANNIFDSSRRFCFQKNQLCFSCGQKLVRNTASFNILLAAVNAEWDALGHTIYFRYQSFRLWFVFLHIFFRWLNNSTFVYIRIY